MPEWTSEMLLDGQLVRGLIAQQFPKLQPTSVALLAEGWDYSVYAVDDLWAFRFPRRAVVVPGTEREIAVLPSVASHLPVPVPAPVYVGRPTEQFPWPFYGARLLPGREACDVGLSDDDRVALARPLARTLRSLHSPKVLSEVGRLVPLDGNRRAEMELRVPRTREALAAVAGWRPDANVDELLDQALRLPAPEATAVCHGDLHFRQLLVRGGELTGIIDWVDVCRSDPAIDLQLVWSFLPQHGRRAFLEEYGPVSEATLLRARVVALFLNAILARYGQHERLPTVETEALSALERTLS